MIHSLQAQEKEIINEREGCIEMTQMKWKITSYDSRVTVRDYLLHVRLFSRRLLKVIKEEGEIQLNGKPVTVRELLNTRDVLQVNFPEEKPSQVLVPMQHKLEKVYEDKFILMVRKESGMAVLPNPNDPIQTTLANAVMFDYQKRGLQKAIHIVTRLDRNTSGLVLIAKDRYTHHLLQQTDIDRSYIAIVEGKLKQKQGVIDLPIDRKLPSIIERTVSKNGKRAITHFQVTEERADYSFIKVRLETGRTHQIRVHFSHLGHPLLGDDLYGGSRERLARQALHCQWVCFRHPFSRKIMQFYSHLPSDMKRL